MSNTKRVIYITLFTILGLSFGFLLHMVLEILYINHFLLKDFKKYSFNLSWEHIILMHWIFVFVLTFLFGIIGFYQGKYWWEIMYVKKKKNLISKLFIK